jgi:hypothetical protein
MGSAGQQAPLRITEGRRRPRSVVPAGGAARLVVDSLASIVGRRTTTPPAVRPPRGTSFVPAEATWPRWRRAETSPSRVGVPLRRTPDLRESHRPRPGAREAR